MDSVGDMEGKKWKSVSRLCFSDTILSLCSFIVVAIVLIMFVFVNT